MHFKFTQNRGIKMNTKSNDNLNKALTLLKQTARSAQTTTVSSSRRADRSDLGELFLAELRMRRAHLREWIDMLNQEADGETAAPVRRPVARIAPRVCRGRHRKACQVQNKFEA
jgi:hypothetical protein